MQLIPRYWTGYSTSIKDLCFFMDKSFAPTIHCKEAASKARRMLFTKRRSFADPLYNTLVRPHLEYAMQACSPNLVTDADGLEQIQRLVTRPYEERLRRLGLHSLHRRRLRGDLIAAYKMFSGGLEPDPSLFFIPPVRPGLRGHPFKVL